jgi:hypothetical protein
MMRPKKLAATGSDPIAWLDQRIRTAKRRNTGGADVLESIQRVLEAADKVTGTSKRARSKK